LVAIFAEFELMFLAEVCIHVTNHELRLQESVIFGCETFIVFKFTSLEAAALLVDIDRKHIYSFWLILEGDNNQNELKSGTTFKIDKKTLI